MGYDLHITRAENWFENEGHRIPAQEWLDVVKSDPELKLAGHNGAYFAIWKGASELPKAWLDWSEGNVFTKNPDEALIRKMVSIGKRLNARVQGDDGEYYDESGKAVHTEAQAPSRARPSFFQNLASVLFGSPRKSMGSSQSTPSFEVGDRVIDTWGNEGSVIAVDPDAEHGLGRVTVRYDDGRELSSALIASGLTRISRRDGSKR